ncbi:MAG: patatin-like phospholipase family protein [Polyangiaceae bacterium]|nr:patatin-like phospholipase family protein [Polyangiaceae bacterium]
MADDAPESHPPFSAAPYPIDHGLGRSGSRVGLVLSGGGMRGAYEAGLLAGLVEVLGLDEGDAPPFGIFAGTSVGAINATYYAANTHRGTLGADGLTQIYRNLSLDQHLRLSPMGMLPGTRTLARARTWLTGVLPERGGHSVLDPRPLEQLVERSVVWERLHDNVQKGRARALLVAALDVASGRTVIFGELSPLARYRASNDPRRSFTAEAITAEHVLASAAIPVLFPTRRVGTAYYCDGGLRFNTPIAPAIRAGASKLVVISLLSQRELPPPGSVVVETDPSPAFLAGKLLNALLLDPVNYDLQVLDRLNKLFETFEGSLSPAALAEVQRTLIDTRGAPYRRIETLVFRPTADIGRIAGKHVGRALSRFTGGSIARRYLRRKGPESSLVEADLASYLLFDGEFAAELIDLGCHDAHARAEDIRRFFQA